MSSHHNIRINFLPKRNTGKKILHAASLFLIFTSLFLLIYPFWGQAEYLVARTLAREKIEIHSNKQAVSRKEILLALLAPNDQLQNSVRAAYALYAAVELAMKEKQNNISDKKIITAFEKNSSLQEKSAGNISVPKKNVLSIPKIGVEINIVEGKNEKALFRGAWRLPGTSSPDLGGNTVLGAHRWLYKPPSSRTFYNLDKVSAGDSIKIFWEGKEYSYRVRETKIVAPQDVEILKNTEENILTLFTCTPLFSSKQRLVVIAKLTSLDNSAMR